MNIADNFSIFNREPKELQSLDYQRKENSGASPLLPIATHVLLRTSPRLFAEMPSAPLTTTPLSFLMFRHPIN